MCSLFSPRHNHSHSIHPTNTAPLNLLNNDLALLQNRLLDVGDPFRHSQPTHPLDDHFRVLRIQLAALAIDLLLLPEHFLAKLPVLVDEPDLLLDLADVLQRLQPLVLLAVALADGVEVLLGLLSSQPTSNPTLRISSVTQRSVQGRNWKLVKRGYRCSKTFSPRLSQTVYPFSY